MSFINRNRSLDEILIYGKDERMMNIDLRCFGKKTSLTKLKTYTQIHER